MLECFETMIFGLSPTKRVNEQYICCIFKIGIVHHYLVIPVSITRITNYLTLLLPFFNEKRQQVNSIPPAKKFKFLLSYLMTQKRSLRTAFKKKLLSLLDLRSKKYTAILH